MPHIKHKEFWDNPKPVQATIKSSCKRLQIVPNRVANYHKLKHTVIMNKEQTEALMLYCDLTFGHRDISVDECLDCIDDDARDLGLTRLQYLDYVAANGKLPK